MKYAIWAFALGASLLAAAPASAQVIITQDSALAGGVTPGDSPGFPVSLSLTGSYKLGSNLSVDRGSNPIDSITAVEVDAANITLDLNGFSIIGGSPPQHPNGTVGVDLRSGVDGVTVKDGTITGFAEVGIVVRGKKELIVDNMIIVYSGTAVYGSDATVINIHNSILSNNFGNGIVCGICLVEGSNISNNRSSGIRAAAGTILGNTIVGNYNEGVISTPNSDPKNIIGIGNNTIINNNRGGRQVKGAVRNLSPNICSPVAC